MSAPYTKALVPVLCRLNPLEKARAKGETHYARVEAALALLYDEGFINEHEKNAAWQRIDAWLKKHGVKAEKPR